MPDYRQYRGKQLLTVFLIIGMKTREPKLEKRYAEWEWGMLPHSVSMAAVCACVWVCCARVCTSMYVDALVHKCLCSGHRSALAVPLLLYALIFEIGSLYWPQNSLFHQDCKCSQVLPVSCIQFWSCRCYLVWALGIQTHVFMLV